MPNSDSVKVAVRVRPFNQREKDAGSRCVISINSSTTSIHDPKNPSHVKSFTFDLAYWSHSGFLKDKDGKLVSSGPNSRYAGQRDIFHDLGEGILDNAWQGYNATLLAYGQTGSGKSYSMIGHGANRGIIPVICEELFKTIQNQDTNKQYQITFSMLEIYNEQVIDLLSKTKKYGGLKVREDQQQGFYVDGLKLVPCDSYAQIERLMEQGTKIRTNASTSMNTTSSRSHMVITIHFKQIFLKDEITKQSIINLVDLAGSERQKSSGSEGDRLKEGTRVNLSLTTLGNVISALAEAAMGKKVLHVPYRDSVLTKLLQSALGGNSRTIMIAAISPADICYDETLSTLRYAERTKKIKNQAVINSGTTAKLINDLKMENCNLLSRLSSLGNSGKTVVDETRSSEVGQSPSNVIILRGLGILDKHATFTYTDGKVTVSPWDKCKVIVNGVPIVVKTKLQHLDRLILGSNSAYLYIGPPINRTCEDLSRYDYDFIQSELAAAKGFSVDKLGAANRKDGKPDPSVLAAFHDYIKLMPLVAEANQMSIELKKDLKLELKVKNLASSDSRGYDLQKEIIIKVEHKVTNQVWIWSKPKFINRKFLMEELYRQFLNGEDVQVDKESDPFWDPVEAIHLGSAHIWLQSLAYCMKLEEQIELLNSEGMEEAILLINIIPCMQNGRSSSIFSVESCTIDFWTKCTILFTVEGCAELCSTEEGMAVISEGSYIIDNPKAGILIQGDLDTESHIAELYQKLLKLEQETELLRDINRSLTEENIHLKAKLKEYEAETHFCKYLTEVKCKILKSPSKLHVNKIISAASRDSRTVCSSRVSCDAEFAKALKSFYQKMNVIRGQFLKLQHYRAPDEDNIQLLRLFTERQSHLLKDFGEQLESSISKLKNDVALIVKKKREARLQQGIK
ncbi:PREDICTED: kinesin-like protein KIF28P [Thamnophis sirtalis]|uniref:Kinesin-like protein KIF28P n=1 Tax=Thamnophis sirtalis TaxID=35019 RepID=A0A6I9WXU9_9SAUR|nr:PREDICTED: kinesin-like protein KIF28P [Thamnophis sirtalis]